MTLTLVACVLAIFAAELMNQVNGECKLTCTMKKSKRVHSSKNDTQKRKETKLKNNCGG